MKMWKNLAKGEVVFNVIEGNFLELFKFLPNNVKSITTEQRLSMPESYYSEGSIVYDKTLKKWMQYIGGKWVEFVFSVSKYESDINISDWEDGQITIPYTKHGIAAPTVKVYMSDSSSLTEVYGCVTVTEGSDVILNSDLAFYGKVVIA